MFGRQAFSFLQKEVAVFNSKVNNLEEKLNLLAQENKELKQICVMLDQEHVMGGVGGSNDSVDSSIPSGSASGLLSVSGTRDSGDGSSNGSTTGSSSPDHRSMVQRASAKEDIYSSGNYMNYGVFSFHARLLCVALLILNKTLFLIKGS